MKIRMLFASVTVFGAASGCAIDPAATGGSKPNNDAMAASEPRCEVRYVTGSMLPVRDACTRITIQPVSATNPRDWEEQRGPANHYSLWPSQTRNWSWVPPTLGGGP